jgi:hypothetical protein
MQTSVVQMIFTPPALSPVIPCFYELRLELKTQEGSRGVWELDVVLEELGGADGDRVLASLRMLGGLPFVPGRGDSLFALPGRTSCNPAVQPPFITLSFCRRLTILMSGHAR